MRTRTVFIAGLIVQSLILCSQSFEEILGETDYIRFNIAYKLIRYDSKKTISILDSLIEKHPRVHILHATKARALQLIDKPDQAILEYKTAIELNPKSRGSYGQLVDLYIDKHQYDSGEFYLLKLLRFTDFGFSGIYQDLAKIARLKNDFEKVIHYANKAILTCRERDQEPNPYNLPGSHCTDIFYFRAEAHMILRNFEQALADIESHKEIYPNNRSILVLQGELYLEMSQHQTSIELLKSYLESPTNDGQNFVHFLIGLNYFRLDEYLSACEHFKIAASLDHNDPDLYNVYLKQCE